MNIRFSSFLMSGCLALTSALSLSAAPVSQATAEEEALKFLYSSHPGRNAAPAQNTHLNCAYTATSGETTLYYIFNFDSGFIITTADDRLPQVLGYSDKGTFDESKISDNMKWWLSEYSREISGYLPTAPESDSNLRLVRKEYRAPIEPLTKTQWDQSSPYNNDCPTSNGRRCVTGCVATAVSQIMKYHQWPVSPTGSNAGITFSGTVYDWANMLDTYQSGKYTSTQAAAVAKLMRQVGAGVNMQYSPYASGAYDSDVQIALSKYFGYAKGLKFYWKDYTPMKDWLNLVYAELAEGRPVYYSGSSSEGGHAFVCDGYSQNDYFHFNWGWGGYQDGYFLLSALNPASGGAGSYEGGYNRGQSILTGIMPANTPGAPSKQQSALISTGGFYYGGDNNFEIREGADGYSLFYNPLGYSETVQVALQILNASDNQEVEYVDLGTETLTPYYGYSAFDADIPNLPDGAYKIYLVFRAEGEKEWQNVQIPLGMQNYVALKVENGVKTLTNDGPDSDYRPKLIVCDPILPEKLYSNTNIAFKLPILNVGDGDFNSELGVSLFNADDEFGYVGSFTDRVSVAGKGYTELQIVMDGDPEPGVYRLYVMDSEENTFIDALPVVISDSGFEQPRVDNVYITNISPDFYVSGTESPIYCNVNNASATAKTITYKVEILDPQTLKRIKFLSNGGQINVNSKYWLRSTIRPFNFDLEPGYYLMRMTDDNDAPLSIPIPLIVESELKTSKEGLAYVVTDEAAKKAVLTAPGSSAYSGDIKVPSVIDGYNITSLRPDAFAFFEGQSVSLPSSITEIPAGGFYCAKSMNLLSLSGDKTMMAADNSFDSTNAANCWLDVPTNLTGSYRVNYVWKEFKMSHWNLQLNDCEVFSGAEDILMLGNNYYPGADHPFTLSLMNSAGKNILIQVFINNKIATSGVIASAGEGFEIPALGIKESGIIRATLTDDPVEVELVTENNDRPSDVYTIDGKLMLKSASAADLKSLPAGIYLHGSKKVIIR